MSPPNVPFSGSIQWEGKGWHPCELCQKGSRGSVIQGEVEFFWDLFGKKSGPTKPLKPFMAGQRGLCSFLVNFLPQSVENMLTCVAAVHTLSADISAPLFSTSLLSFLQQVRPPAHSCTPTNHHYACSGESYRPPVAGKSFLRDQDRGRGRKSRRN